MRKFFFAILLSFAFTVQPVFASCTGTPTACGSIGGGSCTTCGCSWTPGSCSNNGSCAAAAASGDCTGCAAAGCSWDAAGPCSNSGTCGNCANSGTCGGCSCAGCSWGDSSCPWVAAWDGENWIREHEAFPFAIFPATATTSFDSLPALKCVDGQARVKIHEGLPEITYLEDFSAYSVPIEQGLVKPDLSGKARVIHEKITPQRCESSDGSNSDCLSSISDHDEDFFEPAFDEQKVDDWLVVEFEEVSSLDPKLYLVARKQPFLTTYYQYMVHMMGARQFELFSKISTWPVIDELISNWWEDNLQMQVEVWDGSSWQRQGLIAAGYHMPGSGADDFLVSLNKLDTTQQGLKIRLRFMTGGFGIDYLSLDDSPDPNLEPKKISPVKIEFNGQQTDQIKRQLAFNDNQIMTYPCSDDEQIYFSISGYYSPQSFPKTRQKDPLSAWSEFIAFFLSGKEKVVEKAARMGLYKDVGTLDGFTEEELTLQQKPNLVLWFFAAQVIFLVVAIVLKFFKVNKRNIKRFIFIANFFLLIFLFSYNMAWGNASCQGTINCGNCGESDCNTCTQCTWDPAGPCSGTLACSGLSEVNCTGCGQCSWTAGNCSGTRLDCDQHNNSSDCEACGCTWVVSISLNTDGSVAFGTQALNATEDTTASGLNDVETIYVDDGPVDLDVRSSTFSDGSNTWSLDTSNGSNQVHWEFSKNGTDWTSFAVADTYYDLENNVAQDNTQDLYLRLTTPTSTSSYNQHSSTVTIQASAP